MITTLIVEPAWRLLLILDGWPRTRYAAGLLSHLCGLRCGSIGATPWNQNETRCDRVAGHAYMHRNRRDHVGWSTPSEIRYDSRHRGRATVARPRCCS